MNDALMQQRIYSILRQKAAMGAGEYGEDLTAGVGVGGYRRRRRAPVRRVRRRRAYGGDEGGYEGGEEGGVLIGGYRRKRRPSAWNMAVKKWLKSHPGYTVADAAHALKGRGSSKRRTRRGGAVGYGGAITSEDYLLSRVERDKLRKEQKKAINAAFCSPTALNKRIGRAKSKTEVARLLRECGYDPVEARKRGLKKKIRGLAEPDYSDLGYDLDEAYLPEDYKQYGKSSSSSVGKGW